MTFMKFSITGPEILESRIAPATFVVTTLADTTDPANDTGSLRDAMFRAANHAGPDTIKFAPGLTGTISLTGGALPLILDPLTIAGPGPGKITIDAQGNSGIFSINDGSPSFDSPVTISGLSLVHGKVTSGGGGAIYSTESLTLSNCIISGCLAPNAGGIAVYAGATPGTFCKIINSQFIRNEATQTGALTAGGGARILTEKSSVITGSIFFSNTVDSHDGEGGGAYIKVTGAGSGGGGGISLSGDFFAHNIGSEGGGVYLSSNRPIGITSSSFQENISYTGGGAFVAATADSIGGITISKSVFSGNTADVAGGGLELKDLNQSAGKGGAPQSKITLSASVISGNIMGLNTRGGGVDIPAGFAFLNSDQIHGNTAVTSGGGIDAACTSLTITGGSISNNQANASSGGGGLFAKGLQTVSLNHVQFADNRAPNGDAGGAEIDASIANITDTSFVSNSANMIAGLAIAATSNVTITGSSIADNIASVSFGGLFVASPTAHTVIKNSSITGNVSGGGVGGALFYSVTILASGITVSGNVASSGDVGGIAFGGLVTLQNSKIFDNSADAEGGGIFFPAGLSAGSSISNTRVTGNIAGTSGGGIYNQAGGNLAVSIAELALITGNIAPIGPDTVGI